MKNILITVCLVFASVLALKAQEPLFLKDQKVVNIGIGLGSTFYTGSYYTGTVPPLSVSFEKGFMDNVLEKGTIGIGGYLCYSSYKYEYLGWGWKNSNIMVGARGTFHYPLVDKIDTYTGLTVGYNLLISNEFGNTIPGYDYTNSTSGLLWAWCVGGRYYFTEKYAAMAELGYGISYLTLGLSIKI